ncbi:hypothetical protein MSBR3_0016 [Methanosarcina barkeri 3]|uniref:Uncharacterized protein n=1 Tax=Methanosarcina barkeri 3 TaxID=1434107 RepID=A0A0E3SEJ1_METBA|nr:hypothetical protein [Methanosarcina barkeri]AKB80594.1 hypothetical protein MSBR3_0016 [Methanosarcina barkeri 3]
MLHYLEEVLERSAEEKYILENRFIQFKKIKIIFVMLSIFLTVNFSDPFISTGKHFTSFYREKHGLRNKPERRH